MDDGEAESKEEDGGEDELHDEEWEGEGVSESRVARLATVGSVRRWPRAGVSRVRVGLGPWPRHAWLVGRLPVLGARSSSWGGVGSDEWWVSRLTCSQYGRHRIRGQ